MPEYVVRGREQIQAIASRIVTQLSPDKPWKISIAQYKASRSLEQNDRWQAITRALAQETGEEHERLKEQLKIKFGFYEVVEVEGERFMVLKSTKRASVPEMSELMEKTEAFAATEYGIAL